MPKKKGTQVTLYTAEFTVEGSGRFPIDMLRYDSCVPVTESDANAISKNEARKVRLRRFASVPATPTEARWQSFGWHVVSSP